MPPILVNIKLSVLVTVPRHDRVDIATRMRMIRCCMLFVAVATCLLVTSSEAASSAGLRRVEDGGDGESQPTGAPTPERGGDDAPTDEPTAAPVPDDKAPDDGAPAAPAAAGEGEATAPPVPDGNDEDAAPSVSPTGQQNDDQGEPTLAPTRYLPDDETLSPTETPTAEGSNEAPTGSNNGNDSPVAAPSEAYNVDGDSPSDYQDIEQEATEKPVPYVPLDDDPVKDESASAQPWLQPGESPEQMAHDQNVVIAVSVIVGVAFLLTIITAHQMMENPDGCCASTCRLVVGCSCCLFRTVCFPCRAICGCENKRGGRHHAMMSDNSTFTHDLELS